MSFDATVEFETSGVTTSDDLISKKFHEVLDRMLNCDLCVFCNPLDE